EIGGVRIERRIRGEPDARGVFAEGRHGVVEVIVAVEEADVRCPNVALERGNFADGPGGRSLEHRVLPRPILQGGRGPQGDALAGREYIVSTVLPNDDGIVNGNRGGRGLSRKGNDSEEEAHEQFHGGPFVGYSERGVEASNRWCDCARSANHKKRKRTR